MNMFHVGCMFRTSDDSYTNCTCVKPNSLLKSNLPLPTNITQNAQTGMCTEVSIAITDQKSNPLDTYLRFVFNRKILFQFINFNIVFLIF